MMYVIQKCGKALQKVLNQGWDEGYIRMFTNVFINVAHTLIGYRMTPKLDYCFITSTSLVPVTVSTWIQHHWTEE